MRVLVCTILLLTGAPPAQAQISPGELAEAHASLEGMSNCLKCHDLGAGPSAEKCLACHREIADLIEDRKGYHFRAVEIGRQACFECHSDHAGRAFELVHWPDGRERFEHSHAGWKLAGAHATLKCGDCHQGARVSPGFARAYPEVNIANTFLGLDQACLGCHTDPHAGQFARDCTTCHGENKWKPAERFDHAATTFPLRGRHAIVECIRCHTADENDNANVVRYAGIAHDNCTGCHTDPHTGRFGADCASCHGEDAWKPVSKFDHARTAFPLTGKHAVVACDKCHTSPATSNNGDTRFAGLAHDNCGRCHEDPHQARLGADCASCHNTSGWAAVATADGTFDHNKTRYPLVGLHTGVPCDKCHTNTAKTEGLAYDTCERCHTDSHQGQFARRTDGGACEGCHNEQGFVPALYSADDHAATRFALTGAHLALPCVACHRHETLASGASARRFVFDDTGCEACHQDVHASQFTTSPPVKTCTDCHGVESWQTLTFDHDEDSRYRLEGQHRRALCSGCHTTATIAEQTVTRYRPLPTTCAACHTNQPDQLGGSL